MPVPTAAKRGRSRLVASALLTFLPAAVSADLIYLTDGSRLAGELRASTAEGYVIATGFADELTVPAASGISSSESRPKDGNCAAVSATSARLASRAASCATASSRSVTITK